MLPKDRPVPRSLLLSILSRIQSGRVIYRRGLAPLSPRNLRLQSASPRVSQNITGYSRSWAMRPCILLDGLFATAWPTSTPTTSPIKITELKLGSEQWLPVMDRQGHATSLGEPRLTDEDSISNCISIRHKS